MVAIVGWNSARRFFLSSQMTRFRFVYAADQRKTKSFPRRLFPSPEFSIFDASTATNSMNSIISSCPNTLFTCCNDCPLADFRRDEVNLRAIFTLRARSFSWILLFQSLFVHSPRKECSLSMIATGEKRKGTVRN
jgi:hypothetical protein